MVLTEILLLIIRVGFIPSLIEIVEDNIGVSDEEISLSSSR